MECGFKVLENGDLRPFNHVMAEEVLSEFKPGSFVGGDLVKWSADKQRSSAQNAAIHVYCRQLAKAFNDAGHDVRVVVSKIREDATVSWSMVGVKDILWRNIQRIVCDKESTTKLDTAQVSQVYEHVNRFTAERLGISIPFPSRYEQSLDNIKE